MTEINVSARGPLELSTADDPATFPPGTLPHGTLRWTFLAPLSDGRLLRLSMGKKGRNALREMLAQEDAGDAEDAEFLNPAGDSK